MLELNPRKLPQQGRSEATVRAIYDAAVQVLLENGEGRFTTVRVAKRAGVSVGTLYQYFPNKQALLLAVLEEHMARLAQAMEEVSAAHRFQPLETVLDALVHVYVDAKLSDRNTAVALYRISLSMGGYARLDEIRKRCQAAITAALQTANLPASADLRYMARMIYLAMTGAIRGDLEGKASFTTVRKLKEHLVKLVIGYCRAM